MESKKSGNSTTERSLPIYSLIGIIILWLVVGIFGALVGRIFFGPVGEQLNFTRSILSGMIVPHFFGLLFTVLVVRKLGWNKLVYSEKINVNSWVWIAPITIAVASIFVVDWNRLLNTDYRLVVGLVLAVILIACSEEIMFRGITLVGIRKRYGREIYAVLGSTILFSLAHTINSLSISPIQIFATLFGGYIFYLSRRVSGGLWVPIAVHALLDFSLFSITIGSGESSDNRAPLIILAEIIVFVVFVALYPKIQKKI